MKMTKVINAIEAPFNGVVSAFFFEPGELVSDGELLAEVEATEVEALESRETEETA